MDYMERIPFEKCPGHSRDTMRRYCLYHIPPGGFIWAVLSNDLFGAFSRGDDQSIEELKELVRFVYCHVPSICWGNPEQVKEWLNSKPAEHGNG